MIITKLKKTRFYKSRNVRVCPEIYRSNKKITPRFNFCGSLDEITKMNNENNDDDEDDDDDDDDE